MHGWIVGCMIKDVCMRMDVWIDGWIDVMFG